MRTAFKKIKGNKWKELRKKIIEKKRKNRSNHRAIIIYQILHYTINRLIICVITVNVNFEK
jgi:hypothetical protein